MIHVGISVLDDRFIILRREKKDGFDKDYTSDLTQTPQVEMKVEQIVAFGKQRTSQKQRNTVDFKKKRLLDKFPFHFISEEFFLPPRILERRNEGRRECVPALISVCSLGYICSLCEPQAFFSSSTPPRQLLHILRPPFQNRLLLHPITTNTLHIRETRKTISINPKKTSFQLPR